VLARWLPWLVLASGAAGLIDEVVLGRLLALHLGSSGAAHAATLAAFLGGMAAGALAALLAQRRILARVAEPLLAYALLELLIGLWLLLLPPLADAVLGALPSALPLRLTVAGLLVLPLSVPMGATLPVLAVSVERGGVADGVLQVARLYACNAAGATLGALWAGFYAVETWGIDLPLTLSASLSLTVAGAAWHLGKRQRRRAEAVEAVPPPAVGTPANGSVPFGLTAAAATTGVVALVSETAWTRLQALLLGASVYAFAAMLAVVIAGIAAGSAWAARRLAAGANPRRILAGSQAVAGVGGLWLLARLDALPTDLLAIRARLQPVAENYPVWLGVAQAFIAAHLLLPAMGLGAAFPALLASARQAGAATDRATAALLGANTAGNLLGALTGGFVILPLLGLHGALWAAAAASLAVAAWTLPRPWVRAEPLGLAASALGLAGLLWSPPTLGPLDWGLYRAPIKGTAEVAHRVNWNQRATTLFRQDGADASVVVQRYPSERPGGPPEVVFRVNGKADGSSGGDSATQVFLGQVGLLYRPDAREVFVVGLGTGQTAAALAAHPRTQVTVAELSPGVVAAAREFSPWNQRVLEQPRVSVQIADARQALLQWPAASLDLVVSEPSNPWVVGVADLYTVEHFERVRTRLRPQGVLVQWMHAYEIGDRLLAQVICTLRQVFPHLAVYLIADGDLALVASPSPLVIEAAQAEALLRTPAMAALARPGLPRTLAEWQACRLAGSQTVAEVCSVGLPPLQERFPRLEYQAPRDFFAAKQPDALLAALDERLRPGGPPVPTSAWTPLLLQRGLAEERPLLAAAGVAQPEASLLAGLPDAATATQPEAKAWCGWLRQHADWLLKHPTTVLGPVHRHAIGWARRCPPQRGP
jgi:spermidine synthase